jgi:hypothetical protein
MERIADTLNFLACDGIFTPKTLQARLRHLPKDKRRWYISQLCNFDRSWFWHLGESIFLCLEDSMAQGSSVKG